MLYYIGVLLKGGDSCRNCNHKAVCEKIIYKERKK